MDGVRDGAGDGSEKSRACSKVEVAADVMIA
jgi:hypothetical protein